MMWEGCGRRLDDDDSPNSGPFPRSDRLKGVLVDRSWKWRGGGVSEEHQIRTLFQSVDCV